MSSKLILPANGGSVRQALAEAQAFERLQAQYSPAHPFFRFDESVEWTVTDNVQIAMENGYFGEETVKARRLPLAIHYLCTGKVLPAIHLFFFGRPDRGMVERFGMLSTVVHGGTL